MQYVALLLLISALSLSQPVFAQSWTDPISTPPSDNASSPVNISATSQVKAGGFGAASLSSASSAIVGGNLMVGANILPTDPVGVLSSGTYGDAYGKWSAIGRAFSAFPFSLPSTDYGFGTAWDGSGAFFGLTNSGTNKKDTVIGWGSSVPNPTDLIYKYNGAEVARMTNTGGASFKGGVAIGTTTPGASLHIAHTYPEIRLQDNEFNGYSMIHADQNKLKIGADETNKNAFTSLYLAVDGNIHLSVNEGGLVGIGETGPDGILEVSGSAGTSDLFLVSSDDNMDGNRFIIKNNGNVGIGTTTPASKLTVAGTIESSTGGVKFPDGTTQTTAATAGASFWTASSTNIYNTNAGNVGITTGLAVGGGTTVGHNNAKLEVYGTNGNIQLVPQQYHDTAGTSIISTDASQVIAPFELAASRTVLGMNGNVGIGTTNPATSLHVQGTGVSVTNTSFVNGSAGSGLAIAQGGVGDTHVRLQQYNAGGAAYGNIGLNPSGGNVGIGTIAPSAKLEVADGGNASVRIGTTDNRTNANLQVKQAIHAWANSATAYGEVGATDINAYNNGTSPTFAGIFNRYYGTSAVGTISSIFGAANAAGASVLVGQNSSSLNLGVNGANPINFFNSGGTRMSILSDGNVGIGTTTPENAEGWGKVLHVAGGGATSAKIIATANTIQAGLWAHPTGYYGALAGGMAGTRTNHPFTIITNGGTRATFDTAGNVGIGTTAPGVKLDVTGQVRATAQYADYSLLSDATASAQGYRFALDGGAPNKLLLQRSADKFSTASSLMAVDSTGNIGIAKTAPAYPLDVNGTANATNVVGSTGTFNSIAATTFTYASDRNLKKNITPLESSLAKVLKLDGVSFNWKTDTDKAEKKIGFIAQDVEKIFPEVVSGDKVKGVEYANLVAPLVEAVKEQQEIINAQKSKIDSLEDRLEKLEAKIK